MTRLVDDEAVLGEASALAQRLASAGPRLRRDEATALPKLDLDFASAIELEARAGAPDGNAGLPRVPRGVHGEARADVEGR